MNVRSPCKRGVAHGRASDSMAALSWTAVTEIFNADQGTDLTPEAVRKIAGKALRKMAAAAPRIFNQFENYYGSQSRRVQSRLHKRDVRKDQIGVGSPDGDEHSV